MDYYQGVVVDYLRADRSVFVNTEFCIQLKEGNPDGAPHWYCDAVAINLKEKTLYLCEVSYAKNLGALLKRLSAWNSYWSQVKAVLVRDCGVNSEWAVQPWLFIPAECVAVAEAGIKRHKLNSGAIDSMPKPTITTLEEVAPWRYPWNRQGQPQQVQSQTGVE